ncbi:acyltransferase [Streptomyces sp. NPDC048424]|uniref:acyltransferase family protein n=1 Tax=Streptomyces sp. NPDC048424 TaxID=3155265 RepID=UPI00342598DB
MPGRARRHGSSRIKIGCGLACAALPPGRTRGARTWVGDRSSCPQPATVPAAYARYRRVGSMVTLRTPAVPDDSSAAPPSLHQAGSPRSRRLHSLDGLRLLAALMVTAFHFCAFDNWSSHRWGVATAQVFPVFQPIASYGWLGVELFFLISGFVICMSCWGRSAAHFAVGRLIRLYPAYWFAVVFTATVMFCTRHGNSGFTTRRILINLTMLQQPLGVRNIDPTYWTLWAELRFYLLFALVTAVGLTHRRVLGFCAAWLLASAAAPYLGNALLTSLAMPSATPFFAGGILLYLMHRAGPTPAVCLLLAASWLLAQDQLHLLVPKAEVSVGNQLSWPVSLTVVTAFYLILMSLALKEPAFLDRRWLATAGSLTFPLYLLHEKPGWEAIRLIHPLMPPWALLAVLMATLLTISWLVHHYVEQPAARTLRKASGAYGRPRPRG